MIEEHGGIIGDTGDTKDAGNEEKEKEDGEKKENENEDTTKKDDEVEEVEEEEEEEAMEELNDFEENIRLNIIEDEPLLQETLDEIVPMWWNEEPFKLVMSEIFHSCFSVNNCCFFTPLTFYYSRLSKIINYYILKKGIFKVLYCNYLYNLKVKVPMF